MKVVQLLFIASLFISYYVIGGKTGFLSDTPSVVECSTAEQHEILSTDALEIPISNPKTKEIILKHYGYTISYNPKEYIPNWVAWYIDDERLIDRESRKGRDFEPDPLLNADEAVSTREYVGSGWDRGHMCPAADNKWHWRAMDECFYMTNICPQHHNLNRGDWKELEEACRRWAEKEPVYIVAGPILYKKAKYGYIGKTHDIRVPDAFFKVVLSGIRSNAPRAIGFIYKNEAGNNKLDSYVNSIDQVERLTGIDFFPALPDDVEAQIEIDYDLSLWQ